jgi:general stress protein 26
MKTNMSDNIQHLQNEQAIDKAKELVKHNSICHFATLLTDAPAHTRPMSVAKVCDQGNFWFLSDRFSTKNMELSDDPYVQLFFSNPSDSEFMTAYGKASILTDRTKIEELWTPIAKAWFTEGKDDPRISVIKVSPESAYYWDTKSGKMISMLKIVASAVSGKTMNEGVQGELTV